MSNSNRRHFTIVGILVLIGTFVVHALLDVSLPLPTQASRESILIDRLIGQHVWLIAFLFSLVMGFMLYAMVVFRRKEGDEGDGEYMHGNTALEIGWTVLPLILVVVFGWLGVTVLQQVVYADAENEIEIKVTGRQWNWVFEYPDQGGFQSVEMVLPVDKRVRLVMRSEDVNHSFWVPEFRVKQDLIADRETVLRFTPIELGEYKVRCAELCGTLHYNMRSPVRVVEPAEFDAWVQKNQ